MKNDIEKEDVLIKAAFAAGRDATLNQLGNDASAQQLLDVVQLMAHSALTDGGQLSLALSLHNTQVFLVELKKLIEETQKTVKFDSFCGRLM